MSTSNAWAEFAGIFARTRSAHLEHEQAKAELKGLMPEDAKEAIGHGIRAKRSKSGAVSFRPLEPWRTAMQRSSESIAALAARSGQGASRTGQSGEIADRDDPRRTGREGERTSAMPRSRAASILCARPSASMRSRRCRPPPSIRPPARSI